MCPGDLWIQVLSEKFHRGWLRFENITIDYGFTLFDDIEQPMSKQPVPEEEEDIMVKFEIWQQFHWAEVFIRST